MAAWEASQKCLLRDGTDERAALVLEIGDIRGRWRRDEMTCGELERVLSGAMSIPRRSSTAATRLIECPAVDPVSLLVVSVETHAAVRMAGEQAWLCYGCDWGFLGFRFPARDRTGWESIP